MKIFNLDCFSVSVILCACSLMCLPNFLLLPANWAITIEIFLFLSTFIWQKKRTLVINIMLVIASIGYFHWCAIKLTEQAKLTHTLPKKIEIKFKVIDILQQQDYQALVIETQLPVRRFYVNWKSVSQPKLGEIWQGELHIRAISSRLNLGGFDRQKWYLSRGITGYATIKSAVKVGDALSWRQHWLSQALEQTSGLTHQGLLIALGFGERAWLSHLEWKMYQQTNTAHLIAISGLHIGLAFSLGFLLARIGQVLLPTNWINPIFPLLSGFTFALLYSALAGFSIPTLRAIFALMIVLTFRFVRCYCKPWQYFIRTVAMLLLLDPMMLLSESFWLSLSAVGCLIIWYQYFPLSSWLTPQSYCYRFRYLLGLFHLQLGLFVLFTPIQWILFGGFSLNSFIANVITVPFFSLLLVPIVLFATLTQGALSSWQWADYCAEWINQILPYFQHQWFATSLEIAWVYIALLCLTFCGVIYWQQKTDYRFFIVLLSIAVINVVAPKINVPQWQLSMLDVGQGLAMLIVKDKRAILYDTGSSWKNSSMAELEILPYLKRYGLTLDLLILSHDDNDHSGGAKTIIKTYPHLTLLSPSTKEYGEKHHSFCQKGKTWQWQGLNFTILSPEQITARADNHHSCVILLQDSAHSVLFTGDADIAEEYEFLPKLNKITVLQVGHHGSKTSTSESLIKKSKPDIALISSGRWNPWGFPHQTIIQRLMRYQSAVYNSAISGQINVNFYQNSVKVELARDIYSPWYESYFTQ